MGSLMQHFNVLLLLKRFEYRKLVECIDEAHEKILVGRAVGTNRNRQPRLSLAYERCGSLQD